MSRYGKTVLALSVKGVKRPMVVGGPLFHTVDDRAKMVKQLNTEFGQAGSDAMVQMGWSMEHPTAVENDPRWPWYKATVIPLLNEWESFKTEMLESWWDRFNTSWDIIEKWQDRLHGLRQTLASKFTLTTAEPVALTSTMWQEAGSGMANLGAGVAGTLKTLLWVGVIGGLAVLFVFALKGGGKTTAIALRGAR